MSIGHAPESSDSVLASFLTPTVHLLVWFTVVTKLVVLALELLRVHQQSVSVVLRVLPRSPSHRRQVFDPRLPLFFTMSSCSTARNSASPRPAVLGALSATNCLQASNPFLSLHQSQSLSQGQCRKQGVQSVARGVALCWSVRCGM